MFDDSIFPAGLVRDLHSSGPRRRGHLAHKWAHTPMIRVRLVTQFRADHPCDQHQYVPNGTKRSSPVQLRSGVVASELTRLSTTIFTKWQHWRKTVPQMYHCSYPDRCAETQSLWNGSAS